MHVLYVPGALHEVGDGSYRWSQSVVNLNLAHDPPNVVLSTSVVTSCVNLCFVTSVYWLLCAHRCIYSLFRMNPAAFGNIIPATGAKHHSVCILLHASINISVSWPELLSDERLVPTRLSGGKHCGVFLGASLSAVLQVLWLDFFLRNN